MSNKKNIVNDMSEEEQDDLESTVKKKEKKRKSREEKTRDRKVVFWVMLIVILMTVGFWLKAVLGGKEVKIQKIETVPVGRQDSKNQNDEEIDNDSDKESGFFLKYKI